MSVYVYPDIPAMFNIGDQILFPFVNGPQEIDITKLGINRCKIECFGGNNGVSQSWAYWTHYAAGIINLMDLVDKGVYKLYAIVGAGAPMNYGGTVVMQSNVSYSQGNRFGGACSGGGGSADLRTFYDPEKGEFDKASRNSVIIAAAGLGNGRGMPSCVAGKNAPNSIHAFSNIDIRNQVPRLGHNAHIILTVLSQSFLPAGYEIELRTNNGTEKIPLYKGNIPQAMKSFVARSSDGEEVFTLSVPEKPDKDNISIQNPKMRYLANFGQDTNATSDNGSGDQSDSMIVPMGQVKHYIGDIFVVPKNVRRIISQAYYIRNGGVNNPVPYSTYVFDVFPGQIISSMMWLHYTYYDFDMSYIVVCGSNVINSMGRVPPGRGGGHGGGWAAPAFHVFKYNEQINQRSPSSSFFRPYSYFNGDKMYFASDEVKEYNLLPEDGQSVWEAHKKMAVTITIPAINKTVKVNVNAGDRITRYYTTNRTLVAIYNPHSAHSIGANYAASGDVPVNITIAN